ncbi:TonB-dependent receptor [Flavisolibacter ginsengisoli]|jgi:hypothetical protein|uniref:Carboxypeptidase regulatory-like domain-containing protein n=1 Tax=Flavisolibacter ginsengisoli DSM 18119 TaxID=1121884 RepID=A0A1M4X947_9BACT|nr:TonB-dependent receptor [Flavisolibacter ginsengisoli]SHE89946.1 Carboxypeptidase regulatory-like domain-containing protein [Flavisolibacter ginsengisoli DSM 18119]
MRKFFIGIFLLLLTQLAIAQQSSVTGTVADTLGKKTLANAVVSLLQKKDSSLYKFIRTDKEGNFQIPKVDTGRYVILVSFPRFADYVDEVVVKAGETNSIGSIPLTLKSQLLDAVVIRSAGAIRIKGDTTEFVADSFHVKEGATVEELLKKLPGFQVNSKGEITAQGQRVQKVLVDGEEFFGDDPTMATKNIGAKAVDKVQVFDNKSEQQNLTGISTGTEGKTVNIKLKEDKKTGAFGKAEIGSDFDKLLDARLLYNKFIGKKKFSLYGTKSKTNTGSLNWQDQRKLGFENDFEYDELSGYYFSFGTSDDFSDWSLKGLPDAYTAGALYIDRWNNDKQAVNGSYRFNRLGTSNIASKYIQSIIPGRLINTSTLTRSNGLNQQHAINFKYEWKLDSLASLKLVTAGTRKATTSFNNTNTDITNKTDNKETINLGNTSYDSKRLQSDNQLQYKQLFHKKDRQLLSTIRYGITNDDQKNFIYSQADFYTSGNLDSSKLQDQQKINSGSSTTLGAKVTYSEPLNDKWSLVGEYSYNQNNSTSHKNTFDKDFNDKYEILNQAFSNNFDLRASSNSGTLITKYVYKKIRLAFGSGLSATKLRLNNLDHSSFTNYNFTNLTPQASFNFRPKQQSGIGINYRGTTRQPTIDQLQPIRDNNDQLNVLVGNPDLKVGFNHNLSIFYNSYKVLSARGIWLNLGINFTDNAITQDNTIDPSGKRIFKPVNVNGNNNWYMWSEWNKGEGEKKFNHTVRLNGSGGRNINFINGQKNQTDYYHYEIAYGIRYEYPEKYSLNINPSLEYNASKSSLNPNFKNNYFAYGGETEGYLMLPGKLELNTDCKVQLYQQLAAFGGNRNIIIWNANLSRKFFKDKSGKIIFAANDLLNKNQGFDRSINSSMISEERFQRISNYYMLKFEWSFNKMPGQK